MTLDRGVAVEQLAAAPERAIQLRQNQLYAMPLELIAEFQLKALRTRFAQLAGAIPIVRKLAEEQGIGDLKRIEDAGALLLPHSDYKSYPLTVLEKGQFDRLTRWLSGLTVHDLGDLDTASCEDLDDWVDLLDEKTPIRIVSSSGTTGKLSFLPRSEAEGPLLATSHRRCFEGVGNEPFPVVEGIEKIPAVFPNFHPIPLNQRRAMTNLLRYLYDGDEDMIIVPNPARMSLEALSIAGRVLAAHAKGELGQLQLSPRLVAKRDELLAAESRVPEIIQKFVSQTLPQLKGRRVALICPWTLAYAMAVEGAKHDLTRIFSPDSLVAIGGGTKGRVFVEGYREVVQDFFGVPPIRTCYGMSEVISITRLCPHGHYHLYPYLVPYVLDPRSGEQLPRTGVQVGRLGLFDLNPFTYWGGFLSGDRVTLSWGDTEPCPCGRTGAYLHDNVQRYSEVEGGDDKITCAGAPEAHDKALAFLQSLD